MEGKFDWIFWWNKIALSSANPQEPYINMSAPKIDEDYSLHRTYQLFRTLGLRHLTVTDIRNRVVGMITRKDLLPYNMQEKLAIVSTVEASNMSNNNTDEEKDNEKCDSGDEGVTHPSITVNVPPAEVIDEEEEEESKPKSKTVVMQEYTSLWKWTAFKLIMCR